MAWRHQNNRTPLFPGAVHPMDTPTLGSPGPGCKKTHLHCSSQTTLFISYRNQGKLRQRVHQPFSQFSASSDGPGRQRDSACGFALESDQATQESCLGLSIQDSPGIQCSHWARGRKMSSRAAQLCPRVSGGDTPIHVRSPHLIWARCVGLSGDRCSESTAGVRSGVYGSVSTRVCSTGLEHPEPCSLQLPGLWVSGLPPPPTAPTRLGPSSVSYRKPEATPYPLWVLSTTRRVWGA